MKLLTGKRIGQTGRELRTAIFFSFFIHIILFSAVLLMVFTGPPRFIVPPIYRVKLVDLPPGSISLPPTMKQPAQPTAPAPKPQPSPGTKAVQAPKAPKAPEPSRSATVPKDAMPELDQKKPAQKAAEEPAPAKPEPAGGKKQEAVAVASVTGEFQNPPYLLIVRDKVERNWNPPPGATGAKVKVLFRVLRSGRVGDAKLEESSGNFYFDQAAMRAILASSPFPPLPEGFFREYETFSVDLMEKE